MAATDIITGARAKLAFFDPVTGTSTVVGIFTNCSYGLTYDTADLYILGRFSAGAIEYTSQEVVGITCTGWRVVKRGPHVAAGVPKLQDLLTSEYLELSIIDRQLETTQGDGRIAKFRNVRCTGYSTGVNARNAAEITVSFKGILVSDESVENNEVQGSTTLL